MAVTVAVTRPAPHLHATAARLTALGYDPVLAPLLTEVPLAMPPDADAAALALTSRTGARHAARLERLHDRPVFAVGDATAEEARAGGFTNVVSAGGNVDDLLALITDQSAGPVLHVCGADTIGNLAERLTTGGVAAQRLVAYRMDPLPLPPDIAMLDAVLLYSPRTAEIFAAAGGAPPWRDAICIALSPAVAAPVSPPLAGWQVQVADKPNENALFAALHRLHAGASA